MKRKKRRRKKYYILQLSLEIKKFLQMACKLKFERRSQGSVLLNLCRIISDEENKIFLLTNCQDLTWSKVGLFFDFKKHEWHS